MIILMRRIAIVPSNEGVLFTPRGPPKVLSTIVYFNRDSYVGEVDGNGLKSGHGILKRTNGNVYDGEFKDGLKNGRGKFTWAAGTMHGGHIYEGEYKDDEMHGKGKLTMTNRDVYDGEFKDGKMNGKGKYTWANGEVYDGEFKDCLMDGKGKFTYVDGSVYDGEFKDNNMHGKGKLTSADGSVVYDGEFKDDKKHGKGKFTCASGSVYDGEFKDGNRHGKGKITWTDDSVFVGEFKDGLMNGKGKLTLPNGSEYDGEYKSGLMDGKGKLIYDDGEIYEGEFKDGKKHGKGKLTCADGDVYEGEFKDRKRHGKGKLTSADGSVVYDGIWFEGKRDEFGLQTRIANANGGDVNVVFTLDQDHIQCGICHDAFTADMASTDQTSRDLLPVLGFMMGSNGTVACPKCRKADQFMPGNPVPHRMLIDLLRARDEFGPQTRCTNANGGGVDVGDVYEGEFKDRKRHGKGKLTSADGSVVYDGIWFEGKRDEFGLQTRIANANGGDVNVVFTLDQDHIQCGICHDAFTADMASTDLPVLGACGHYFCHGCIVRCRFMVGSNGTVGCPKCRKADQFMPGNPVPHRILIDLLRSARPIDMPSSA